MKKELATTSTGLAPINTVVTQEALDLLQSLSQKGIQDMGMNQSMPVLRVHSASSTKNILPDGSFPAIGSFFYTANKEELKNPVVRILTIKKCKLPKMKDKPTDEAELKANYVVAGLLFDTGEPFVMYINGLSYNKVWLLQDQLKPWVKKMKIPMFALQIRLSTAMEQDQAKKYAPKPVVMYELVMNDTNEWPLIEQDVKMIRFLAEATDKAEEEIQELVANLLEQGGFDVPAQKIKENSELKWDKKESDIPDSHGVEDIADQVDDEEPPF